MEIYTLGFAGKTAEQFFELLKQAHIRQLVDIRLNNVSQLAGFTKKGDLPYFLRKVAGIDYHHELQLAPTPEMLKAYRGKEISWAEYEELYRNLIEERGVASALRPGEFLDRVVLLCSEAKADKCHRRLAAEYLQSHWPNVTIVHL